MAEQLDPLVEKYEGRSSEFLAGALGGVGGAGLVQLLYELGYIGKAFAISFSPTALLFGVLFSLFIFRGPQQWRREREQRREEDERRQEERGRKTRIQAVNDWSELAAKLEKTAGGEAEVTKQAWAKVEAELKTPR